MLNQISIPVRPVAFDLSWSRLAHGRAFASDHQTFALPIDYFVGDMASIPLADNSVDVAMTVHALKPNGGREHELVSELLRFARRKVVLFEPSFEQASP
jgi:ubiquinone/menaquinone biosynthesis C-methylase UbiE